LRTASIVPLLCAALLAAGCVPVYMSPAANAPLLSRPGEFQVGGYLGTQGLDLQGAVAVADHTGIIADLSNTRSENQHDYRTYGELGVGYYDRLSRSGRVELFAGAGLGESGGDIGDETGRGSFYRGFGQLDIGRTGALVDVGLSARLAYVGYSYDFRSDAGPYQTSDIFFEPALFWRVGYKWIKVGMQVGLTVPVLGNDETVDTNWLNVTLGLRTKLNGF
jgi:hypothetical protein